MDRDVRICARIDRLVARSALAIALVLATWLTVSAFERVKTRQPRRTIAVTGSAKKRIVSDLIEWNALIQSQDADRIVAYRRLHEHMGKALAYLEAQGIKKEEVHTTSVSVSEIIEHETVKTGTGKDQQVIERAIHKGFTTTQVIAVTSGDVARVERVASEITQLLEQGVDITSHPPAYYYTHLSELKIQMLAEAARDARTRAENVVRSAGGTQLGSLQEADMGIINVNPANSTETSWQGNNDTSSLEKDIITIVHVRYKLPEG
jgi:uncharacterized protein